MAEPATARPGMARWLRRSLLALAGLLLVGLIALVVTVYVLLQPERFTAMLQSQAADAGLELNLASPAHPTLFPRPALALQGITLAQQGASMPILIAARGRLVLPWRTLFGGPTVISQLEIDAPRVDLQALQDWLASLPASQGAPAGIPRIDAGVSITRGSLVSGNRMLLGDLALEAGSLQSGQPFPLNLSATDAAGTPLQLRLTATPRISGNALQLDNVALHFSEDSSLVLQLGGQAHWHGAADAGAALTGTLDQADAGKYDVALALTPANDRQPLLLSLRLDGPGNHADLQLPPLALAHWWSQLTDPQGPHLSMPPASGHVQAAKADLAGIHIEGLTLAVGPAMAASVGAPAVAASAPVASP